MSFLCTGDHIRFWNLAFIPVRILLVAMKWDFFFSFQICRFPRGCTTRSERMKKASSNEYATYYIHREWTFEVQYVGTSLIYYFLLYISRFQYIISPFIFLVPLIYLLLAKEYTCCGKMYCGKCSRCTYLKCFWLLAASMDLQQQAPCCITFLFPVYLCISVWCPL